MAYREFRNVKTWEAPEIDLFPKTLAVLQNAQKIKAQREIAKQNRLANFKADELSSKFNTDQEKLNSLMQDVTQKSVRDIMTYGYVTPETTEQATRAKQYAELSKSQYQMFSDAQKLINDKAQQNPYYNPDADRDLLAKATYGSGESDEEVNWFNRADRLNQAVSSIGQDYLSTFNKDKYLSDWVEKYKTQSIDKSSKGTSGIKTGSKIQAVFFDENWVPKVTDKHAIELLDSSPDVKKRYQQELLQQVGQEAKQMMASKDEGTEWMQGKSIDDVVAKLINEPSLNKINKKTFGERQRELAKSDLERKQRQNLATSYDAGDFNPSSRYGVTAKGVSANESFNPAVGGAGLQFRNDSKTNPFIRIPTRSQKRLNLDNGKVTDNALTKDMMLEDVVVVPVRADGTPVDLKAKSFEELKQKIEALTPEQAKDITGATLAFIGRGFNKRQALDAANALRSKNEATAATTQSDAEREQAIRMNQELDNMLSMIQMDSEGLNVELMQSFLGNDIITHEMIPVSGVSKDEFNIAALNNATGSNLGNKKNWSEGMIQNEKLINDLLSKKHKEYDQWKREGTEAQIETIKKNSPKTEKKAQSKPVEREQDGNIFVLDVETGEYKFLRKK